MTSGRCRRFSGNRPAFTPACFVRKIAQLTVNQFGESILNRPVPIDVAAAEAESGGIACRFTVPSHPRHGSDMHSG